MIVGEAAIADATLDRIVINPNHIILSRAAPR